MFYYRYEIDANEHSCKSSGRLCVLSEFTDEKCLFHFAVKRTNVLSILCDSGHLSYTAPMDVHSCNTIPSEDLQLNVFYI